MQNGHPVQRRKIIDHSFNLKLQKVLDKILVPCIQQLCLQFIRLGTIIRKQTTCQTDVEMSYNKSLNPFEDDDNDEYTNSRSRNYPREEPLSAEGRRRQIMEQIDDSERRQLESTRNALASIADSERMGVATAEELLRQREQLDNIENKTVKVNQDLKTSQKHLTNIKSIFGGIKNWWNGDKDKDQPKATVGTRPSALQDTLDKQKSSGVHPSERLRTDNGRGFYEEEEDLDSKFLNTARKTDKMAHGFTPVTHSEKEKALNENLDMMSDGMARLKGLALGLGDEISAQNDQLDRITGQVDRADVKIKDQNRQMRHILK